MIYDVVIVGGGLTGLTTAHSLLKLQKPDLSLMLLESSSRLGGVIQTINKEDFIIETGANSFSSADHSVISLCEELDIQPVASSVKSYRRYVFHRNRLCKVPTNIGELIASGMLSFKTGSKNFKTFLNSSIKGKFEPDSLITLLLNDLLDPFMVKLYLSSEEGNTLSQKIRTPQLFSFEEGMETLIKALYKSVKPDNIRLSADVKSIFKEKDHFVLVVSDGNKITTRSLVIATPAWRAAELLRNSFSDLSEHLKKIHYIPLWVVHFGFSDNLISRAKDGFGFIVSRQSKSSLLASIWMSNLFSDHAPKGYGLFSCYAMPVLSKDEAILTDSSKIREDILNTLRVALREPLLTPCFERIFYYQYAFPVYKPEKISATSSLKYTVNNIPGLFLAGNYLHGISVNSCVDSGNNAAKKVLQYLFP